MERKAKAYLNLIRWALQQDEVRGISVHCYGQQLLANSDKYNKVKAEVESVDECSLLIHKTDGSSDWARIILDLDPDETVVDWSSTPLLARWENSFFGGA